MPGAPAAAAGLVAGDAIVTDQRHPRIRPSATRSRPLDDLQANAGQTVILGDPARRRHHRATSAWPCGRPDGRASQGRSGSARRPSRPSARSTTRSCEAVQLGASARSTAFSLILVRPRRPRPARSSRARRGAAGVRPGRDRGRAGQRPVGPRPALRALPDRAAVGQPRARQHPAVPAPRRRPDARDRAQGDPALRHSGSRCAPSSSPTPSGSWRCSRS